MTLATESRIPAGLTAADLGQSVSKTVTIGGAAKSFHLVSYLTAPVPTNMRLDYVLFTDADIDRCEWTFKYGRSSFQIPGQSDRQQRAAVTVPAREPASPGAAPPTIEVTVEAFDGDDDTLSSLTLTQATAFAGTAFDAIASDRAFDAAQRAYSMREICVVLRDYIIAATSATGPTGIPARLLAAILIKESMARPQDGSPKANLIRKNIGGEEFTPRLDVVQTKFWGALDNSTKHMRRELDDIREPEIDMVRDFYNEDLYGVSRIGPKSIGVGQIAQTTAAMALGKIAWRLLPAATPKPTLEAIELNYKALSLDDRIDIFNQLRFPKRHVMIAAKILAAIKNGTPRYPALTAAALAAPANLRAVQVIATEYNRGAHDTAEADVKISSYGEFISKLLTDQRALFDRYFPVPP
jgi:hypothetical protein